MDIEKARSVNSTKDQGHEARNLIIIIIAFKILNLLTWYIETFY